MTDDLTPWEEMKRLEEIDDELRERGFASPSDAIWDDGGSKSQIVKPASAPYPPPYDPGASEK